MGVSVILDLENQVSAADLRQFLSFLPEASESACDLRVTTDLRVIVDDHEVPHFLAIQLPTPHHS